jgi:hypothetical protein
MRDTPILIEYNGGGWAIPKVEVRSDTKCRCEAIGAYFAGWKEIVSIEIEAEYVKIAEARMKYWTQFSSYEEGLKNEGTKSS